MTELVEKLFAVHDALTEAGLAHAFGGAVALAYCVEEPRGTRDLDVNIFTPAENARRVLDAMPPGVEVTEKAIVQVLRDGQTRLFWGGVPVDLFLNNHPFHEEVAEGVVWVSLEGREVPMLDCASLVVFKSLFDRTKDWADIEAIAECTPTQVESAVEALTALIGDEDDETIRRIKSVLEAPPERPPRIDRVLGPRR